MSGVSPTATIADSRECKRISEKFQAKFGTLKSYSNHEISYNFKKYPLGVHLLESFMRMQIQTMLASMTNSILLQQYVALYQISESIVKPMLDSITDKELRDKLLKEYKEFSDELFDSVKDEAKKYGNSSLPNATPAQKKEQLDKLERMAKELTTDTNISKSREKFEEMLKKSESQPKEGGGKNKFKAQPGMRFSAVAAFQQGQKPHEKKIEKAAVFEQEKRRVAGEHDRNMKLFGDYAICDLTQMSDDIYKNRATFGSISENPTADEYFSWFNNYVNVSQLAADLSTVSVLLYFLLVTSVGLLPMTVQRGGNPKVDLKSLIRISVKLLYFSKVMGDTISTKKSDKPLNLKLHNSAEIGKYISEVAEETDIPVTTLRNKLTHIVSSFKRGMSGGAGSEVAIPFASPPPFASPTPFASTQVAIPEMYRFEPQVNEQLLYAITAHPAPALTVYKEFQNRLVKIISPVNQNRATRAAAHASLSKHDVAFEGIINNMLTSDEASSLMTLVENESIRVLVSKYITDASKINETTSYKTTYDHAVGNGYRPITDTNEIAKLLSTGTSETLGEVRTIESITFITEEISAMENFKTTLGIESVASTKPNIINLFMRVSYRDKNVISDATTEHDKLREELSDLDGQLSALNDNIQLAKLKVDQNHTSVTDLTINAKYEEAIRQHTPKARLDKMIEGLIALYVPNRRLSTSTVGLSDQEKADYHDIIKLAPLYMDKYLMSIERESKNGALQNKGKELVANSQRPYGFIVLNSQNYNLLTPLVKSYLNSESNDALQFALNNLPQHYLSPKVAAFYKKGMITVPRSSKALGKAFQALENYYSSRYQIMIGELLYRNRETAQTWLEAEAPAIIAEGVKYTGPHGDVALYAPKDVAQIKAGTQQLVDTFSYSTDIALKGLTVIEKRDYELTVIDAANSLTPGSFKKELDENAVNIVIGGVSTTLSSAANATAGAALRVAFKTATAIENIANGFLVLGSEEYYRLVCAATAWALVGLFRSGAIIALAGVVTAPIALILEAAKQLSEPLASILTGRAVAYAFGINDKVAFMAACTFYAIRLLYNGIRKDGPVQSALTLDTVCQSTYAGIYGCIWVRNYTDIIGRIRNTQAADEIKITTEKYKEIFIVFSDMTTSIQHHKNLMQQPNISAKYRNAYDENKRYWLRVQAINWLLERLSKPLNDVENPTLALMKTELAKRDADIGAFAARYGYVADEDPNSNKPRTVPVAPPAGAAGISPPAAPHAGGRRITRRRKSVRRRATRRSN